MFIFIDFLARMSRKVTGKSSRIKGGLNKPITYIDTVKKVTFEISNR